MFKSLLLTALLLLPLPAAAATLWQVDKEASKLTFTARQGDETFTGGFNHFTPAIRFSPDDLAGSSISVTVDIASIHAGSADRDAALPTAPWFDAARFPEAVFATRSIRADGPGKYIAEATLTMRGISKDLQLPFTLTTANGKTRATGDVVIQRNDYSIGTGEFATDSWVKFPVTISIDIWATPAAQ